MMNLTTHGYINLAKEQNRKFEPKREPLKREPKAPTNANYTWTAKDYKNN